MRNHDMPEDKARSTAYDAFTTGQPATTAAQLTGRSLAWAEQEYRTLRRRGVSPMAGQLAFDLPNPE
ncbi:hypothetical protein [Streptomyces sp. NPDC002044]|uniref:hypothetical protein n=1 Tax=Streptomyces sp. NPDC002044 TaxID=3154662 RepID=UPI003325A914